MPGCCWIAAPTATTRAPPEMLEEALVAYRAFGMPAYGAEAERLLSRARSTSTQH